MLTQAQEAEALIAGSKANAGPSTQQTNVIPGVSTTVAPIPGSHQIQPQSGAPDVLHPMLSDLVRVIIVNLWTGLLTCFEGGFATNSYGSITADDRPQFPVHCNVPGSKRMGPGIGQE